MSFYGSTESRRLGFRPPGQARYAAPFRLWWQLVLAHVMSSPIIGLPPVHAGGFFLRAIRGSDLEVFSHWQVKMNAVRRRGRL